jgi:hypothetical protein
MKQRGDHLIQLIVVLVTLGSIEFGDEPVIHRKPMLSIFICEGIVNSWESKNIV